MMSKIQEDDSMQVIPHHTFTYSLPMFISSPEFISYEWTGMQFSPPRRLFVPNRRTERRRRQRVPSSSWPRRPYWSQSHHHHHHQVTRCDNGGQEHSRLGLLLVVFARVLMGIWWSHIPRISAARRPFLALKSIENSPFIWDLHCFIVVYLQFEFDRHTNSESPFQVFSKNDNNYSQFPLHLLANIFLSHDGSCKSGNGAWNLSTDRKCFPPSKKHPNSFLTISSRFQHCFLSNSPLFDFFALHVSLPLKSEHHEQQPSPPLLPNHTLSAQSASLLFTMLLQSLPGHRLSRMVPDTPDFAPLQQPTCELPDFEYVFCALSTLHFCSHLFFFFTGFLQRHQTHPGCLWQMRVMILQWEVPHLA